MCSERLAEKTSRAAALRTTPRSRTEETGNTYLCLGPCDMKMLITGTVCRL